MIMFTSIYKQLKFQLQFVKKINSMDQAVLLCGRNVFDSGFVRKKETLSHKHLLF
jgi:hypothetical protein